MQSKVDIVKCLTAQRSFYASGATRPLQHRLHSLRQLKTAIQQNEAQIFAALKADLAKSTEESYLGEIGLVYDEIHFALRHVATWMRPERVTTPLLSTIGRSRIHREPLGVILIIGPWNYPLQLLMAPLVGAIAAGNCAILKPSELAPRTSQVVARIIQQAFAPEFISVVEGGVEESQSLLAESFDHIFFTGGTSVGKVVMTAAAQHLTPVTLELGGKSPCIVDEDIDVDVTARRIAWGKFFNAGQTCVAPDYLLVHAKIKSALLERIRHYVEVFFGDNPVLSSDYARIINARHYARLTNMLEAAVKQGAICHRAGDSSATRESVELYLAPTLVENVPLACELMTSEIFGPLLPIVEFQKLDEAIRFVQERDKPLALYFFSRSKALQKRIVQETSFGGGCMNDTLIHLANPRLPFGGVGGSGMGAYHGRYSFETFSHRKSVVQRTFTPDPQLRYPPYKGRLRWLRWLMG